MAALDIALGQVRPLSRAFIEVLTRNLGGLGQEVLLAVYISGDGRTLGHRLFASGEQAVVAGRYRALIEPALRLGAQGILLAHNHPSGDPRPSVADIEMTRGLQALLRLLDFDLVDHLILGGGQTTSMRGAGLMIEAAGAQPPCVEFARSQRTRAAA